MIGMWFNKDHMSKHHDGTYSKDIGLLLQILINTLLSTINIIGRSHVSISVINKHALPTTITKAW